LGNSICHFILARLLAFPSNLEDLFSQQRHKAQQTVLKFSSSEAAINQATNHHVDHHGRKRKRHGHQKPATIAREEEDEVQARQDEFVLQAKRGGSDPEAKRYEWLESLQRVHPSFVCLQAWS
jgi:hypothetical protein